jgi:hypothetical protein
VTEPAHEEVHPGTTVPPVEPDAELARKNLMWGLALFGIALAIAGGTIVIALIYNAVSDY